jgi:hypothetical protein
MAESNAVPVISEVVSDIPFATKEPETYQAEIVVTSSGIERRMFIARSGNLRRSDYNVGEPNQFSILQSDKNYLIAANNKIFAENTAGQLSAALGGPFDEFTSTLLYSRRRPDFKSLGSENGLSKYSVRLDKGHAAEAVIFVDEAAGFPVRQELYSLRGDERTLQYTVEIRNLILETDPGTFEIPAGFRQTSIEEVRRSLAGNDE